MDGGYEGKTGGQVLAIAHNGNLSNGTMFPIVEAFGKTIDRNYAETRARWEPIDEIDPDQGRRRGAPLSLAQRRVRGLRDLGQVQPGRQRAEDARRCSSASTPARRSRTASARGEARRQSLQVRHDRQHRRAHRPRRRRGGQLLRQDTPPQEPSPERMDQDRSSRRQDRRRRSWTGGSARPATRRSGPRRTRARRSSTR